MIGGGRKPGGRREPRDRGKADEFDKIIISIRRVTKVRPGAKRMRFSAMVAVGDRKGRVYVAVGRGTDTKSAINKGYRYAANHLVRIDLLNGTVPHAVTMKYAAAKVLVKPAGPGTGVIASGPVRAVLEMAGVRNVLTKQFGSNNPISNAYCTMKALQSMSSRRILDKQAEYRQSKLSKGRRETAPDPKKD